MNTPGNHDDTFLAHNETFTGRSNALENHETALGVHASACRRRGTLERKLRTKVPALAAGLCIVVLLILGVSNVVNSKNARAAENHADTNSATIHFAPLDIYFDTGTHPLAAYQFELKILSGDVAIVGIEGGEHPAFAAAPYYDPAALQHQRVIVGAFNTGTNLPTGKTRVARIHLMITGDTKPEYQITVQAAATADGSPITATASVQEGTKP